MPKRSLTILWVDDSQYFGAYRNQLVYAFDEEYYEIKIIKKRSIDDAYRIYESMPVDLIITDISIPWGDYEQILIDLAIDNGSFWATASLKTEYGGLALINLIKELVRFRTKDINARISTPVIYTSAYYRQDRFIDKLRLWHEPGTYFWLDIATQGYDEAAYIIHQYFSTH